MQERKQKLKMVEWLLNEDFWSLTFYHSGFLSKTDTVNVITIASVSRIILSLHLLSDAMLPGFTGLNPTSTGGT